MGFLCIRNPISKFMDWMTHWHASLNILTGKKIRLFIIAVIVGDSKKTNFIESVAVSA